MATLTRELIAAERLHAEFAFSYAQVAHALNTNEATLHRWRAGKGGEPTLVYRRRLAALEAFLEELHDVFALEVARRWMDEPLAALKGQTPRRMILDGHVDRVTGLLYAINAGISR